MWKLVRKGNENYYYYYASDNFLRVWLEKMIHHRDCKIVKTKSKKVILNRL